MRNFLSTLIKIHLYTFFGFCSQKSLGFDRNVYNWIRLYTNRHLENFRRIKENGTSGGFIHIISNGYTHFINKLWINPVNLVDNYKKLVGNRKKGNKQRIKKENILTEA